MRWGEERAVRKRSAHPLVVRGSARTPLAMLGAMFATLALAVVSVPQDVRVADAGALVSGVTVVRDVAGDAPASSSPAAVPTPMPGWPVTITTHQSFHPNRNVTFADLDADGRMEIVRPSTDGRVHVFRHDGTPLPGWPQAVTGWCQVAPAVADLDGDGFLEIAVATRGITSGGRLYVLDRLGNVRTGWPVSFNNNNVESVVAADLDGDGRPEILAAERAYPIGRLHVLRADGSPLPGWPFTMDHVPALTPAVGDVDADGSPEVVVASYTSLYVLSAGGTVEPGWPVQASSVYGANFSYQSPALADLDGDGRLEIAICTHQSGAGCYVFRHDGTQQSGWPQLFGGTWSYCPPTIADLDGDGALDVLAGRAGGTLTSAALYAWNRNGQLLPGFPYATMGGAESPITVAEIDGDPELEVFFGTSVMSANMGYLHCVDGRGVPEAGFPLRTAGFTYLNGATIGDVDGDGVLEIGALANRDTTGTLYLWKLTGPTAPGRIAWKGYHEGNERRGRAGESDRFAITGHARPGGTLLLELQVPPASAAAVLLGTRTAVLPIVPFGVLRLDPTAPLFTLLTLPPPPAGRAVVPVMLPNNPTLRGLALPMQGVAAGAAIELLQMQMVVVQ